MSKKKYVEVGAVLGLADVFFADPILRAATRAILVAAPAANVIEPVEAHWEKSIDNDTVMHKCSGCGARVVKGLYEYENPNLFCYHCGAKMGERKISNP